MDKHNPQNMKDMKIIHDITKDILLTKKMILDQVDICRKLNINFRTAKKCV